MFKLKTVVELEKIKAVWRRIRRPSRKTLSGLPVMQPEPQWNYKPRGKRNGILMPLLLLVAAVSVRADIVVHAPASNVRTLLIVQSTREGWTLTNEDYRWVIITCWDKSPRGIPVLCKRAYLIVPLDEGTCYVQSYADFWRPDGYQYSLASKNDAATRAQQLVVAIEYIVATQPEQPPQRNIAPLTNL
jgi:hypothetical protein